MSAPASAPPPFTAARLAACLALGAALVWAGWQQEMLFAQLTRGWNSLFGHLGLGSLLARMQQNANPEVTKSSIPAMLTGSLAYVGGCLLLLHLLLRDERRTRWVLGVYGVLLGLCILFVLLGKVTGSVLPYKLVRRIINILVSPLPAMLLLPLLWPRKRQV